MNKRNRHARQGHSELTPADSIHLGPGERIRLEETPIADSGGDKQVGNRLYNDKRYLIASKNQVLRLVDSGTLIFISLTVGTVAGTIWIEDSLERTFDGNMTFAGPPTGITSRWDIVETVPGQSTLRVKTAGESENPVKLMPTLGSLMVFEVLWDVNGIVFINIGEGQTQFSESKYKTATQGLSINTLACIWRQKPSPNNTYLFKLDYLEFSSSIYADVPPRNGSLHLSFVMDFDNLIAANRIQFYTNTQGSVEGDFVLIQNGAGELELYHRRNSYFPQLEFRITMNHSTVFLNSFINGAIHTTIDLTGGYLSQPILNGGSVGVGAGLSLDDTKKVQLGNDGAGIIDYSDDSVFTGGLQYIYNSADKSMSSLFADAEFRINTNWDSLIDSNSSSANIEIQSNVGSEARIDLTKTVNGVNQRIFFDPTTNLITITDQINSKGLENLGDYEANFTARSLVTKQYVLSLLGGGSSKWTDVGSDIYRNSRVLIGGTAFSDAIAKQEVNGASKVNDLLYQKPTNTAITAGTTLSIDMTKGANLKRYELQANMIINFGTNPTANDSATYTFVFKQDATGGRTVTWNTSGTAVLWQGGVAPLIADGINQITVITIMWTGQEYLGVKSCGFNV